MKRELLMLNNLTCPSCAADLEKALRRMEGVRQATVAFATGMLEVEYDETAVGAREIEGTVTGFGVDIGARLA